MNAPEPVLKNHLDGTRDTGVDLVVVARGGATALMTTLFKLYELQSLLPHHLTDYNPYYLADSAGAYAVYGLVAPSLQDPTRPCMTPGQIFKNFLLHSSAYLSPNRELALHSLIEHAGTPRVSDTLVPVTFSTVDITDHWKRAYFTHFPKAYMAEHSIFKAPANSNDHNYMHDAVLASSAYALLLGEHRINGGKTPGQIRRTMDMAFTENHSANLMQYAESHREAFKGSGRKVVCVILGNNFLDFKTEPEQALSAARMNKHLPDIVRYLSHMDLVSFAERLYGQENVFDLTLMIPQNVTQRNLYNLPPPFRGDSDAILQRYDWTQRMLDQDEAGHARIIELAQVLRDGAKPRPNAPPLTSGPQEQAEIHDQIQAMRTRAEQRGKFFALSHELAENMKPASNLVLSQADPALKALAPIAHGISKVLKVSWTQAVVPAAKGVGSFLAHSWEETASVRAHALESVMNKLLPPKIDPSELVVRPIEDAPQMPVFFEADETATPPSPPHSSERHTLSEFEHRLP